jgi:hypothetical protein
MNMKQMQRLINSCNLDTNFAVNLIRFVLFDFQPIYKKYRIFSERKLTVLWIYKYGQSDSCNYLQTLPKELLRVILDYVNEPPIFYELAALVLKLPEVQLWLFPMINDIKNSPYICKLILEGDRRDLKNRLMAAYVTSMPQSILRRDYCYIRYRIHEQSIYLRSFTSITKFLLKHETDPVLLNKFHKAYFKRPLDFTEAFKTKNIYALRFFVENNAFVMPSRTTFESKMKPPKYNMTYEAALALIDDIKKPKQ